MARSGAWSRGQVLKSFGYAERQVSQYFIENASLLRCGKRAVPAFARTVARPASAPPGAILSRLGNVLASAVPRCAARGSRTWPQGGPMTTMLRKIDRDVKRFRQIVRGVDQEGIPQVPDPERADRPPGQAHRLHPPSPDRDPALPLRQQGGGRRRPGRRARPAKASDGDAGHRSPATTSWRRRSRSTSWPPSWARSWSCRASSRAAAARCRSRRSSTRTSAGWARRACATSSARSARP